MYYEKWLVEKTDTEEDGMTTLDMTLDLPIIDIN